MRQRMLAEGREAGLVGELASASPAELLGTVAQHYTPATGAEEIAIWRAARGGALDPLIQAIRDCPFLSRKAAMLNILADGIPEGGELLASLLHDPELGPVVFLAQKRDRKPDEVSPEESRVADGRKHPGTAGDRGSGRGTGTARRATPPPAGRCGPRHTRFQLSGTRNARGIPGPRRRADPQRATPAARRPERLRAKPSAAETPQSLTPRIWPCNRVVDLIGMIALWGN
jgi:hypothetical protein